jgi:hypothetical protein
MIVSLHGLPTPTTAELGAVLATLKPRARVSAVVTHQSGKKTTLHVTLGTFPGS